MTTETTQEAVTRYRQKGGEVEARQLLDDLRNHTAIATWIEGSGGQAGIPFAEPCLYVETVEGRKRADIGDWIVRYPDTFRVLSDSEFTEAFEPAGETGTGAADVTHDPRTDWCACEPNGPERCDYRMLADAVIARLDVRDGDEAEVALCIAAVEAAADGRKLEAGCG